MKTLGLCFVGDTAAARFRWLLVEIDTKFHRCFWEHTGTTILEPGVEPLRHRLEMYEHLVEVGGLSHLSSPLAHPHPLKAARAWLEPILQEWTSICGILQHGTEAHVTSIDKWNTACLEPLEDGKIGGCWPDARDSTSGLQGGVAKSSLPAPGQLLGSVYLGECSCSCAWKVHYHEVTFCYRSSAK